MADENYDAGVFRFGIVPQPSDNTFEPGTHGLPSIEEREFGRVVVILGSNGAGKSRLLKLFTSRPEVNGELRPIVFVEGGRTCTVGPNGKPRPLELVQSNTQADRQQEVFNLVESDRRQAVWLHKKLLYEWDIKGADPKTKPNLHESRFDRVSAAFTSIFPHLTLVAYTHIVGDEQDPDGPTFQWWIRADGKAYHSSWASDGEKQVLTLLCDIGELARPHSLVIVDEPDLNLHPSLAITLWNEIERMQPDCIFVYATHSLSFAMRQNVSNVVVLRRKGQTPVYLDRPFEWSYDELQPFLGSIPAIVTQDRLLAVEGNDSSFDRDFYAWVVGSNLKISPLGDCEQVQGAVRHHGVWSAVGNLKIFGIIDRDFRSDEKIKSLHTKDLMVLKYHEAESYLCHPRILADSVKFSGKTELTSDDFASRLAELCKEHLSSVAIERTALRSQIRLAIGPSSSGSRPKEWNAMKAAVTKWAEDEAPNAENYPAYVAKTLEEEYSNCKDALERGDVEKMLALFPGKELLEQLARYAGFNSPSRMLSAMTANLSPAAYPQLVEIREAVGKQLI